MTQTDRPARTTRHLAWWLAAAGAAAITVALLTGALGWAHVTSPSMAPTHPAGSTIVTTTIGAGDVERGDIVVFEMPASWIAAEQQRLGADDPVPDRMVKRIIGLPGDRVTCCAPGGRLLLNGRLLDEPYLAEEPGDLSNATYDVTVPPGHAWVLGDNRRRSFDSRAMRARSTAAGFLNLDSIRAKALFNLP